MKDAIICVFFLSHSIRFTYIFEYFSDGFQLYRNNAVLMDTYINSRELVRNIKFVTSIGMQSAHNNYFYDCKTTHHNDSTTNANDTTNNIEKASFYDWFKSNASIHKLNTSLLFIICFCWLCPKILCITVNYRFI